MVSGRLVKSMVAAATVLRTVPCRFSGCLRSPAPSKFVGPVARCPPATFLKIPGKLASIRKASLRGFAELRTFPPGQNRLKFRRLFFARYDPNFNFLDPRRFQP